MSVLDIRPMELEGLLEIRPPRLADSRGFFSEVWRGDQLAGVGIDVDFVQDNHSYSSERGVLRGLHFQVPPAAQDKLVRVAAGSIFDVAVDIRRASPTFGRWAGLVLSADQWNQLYIPKGFMHGFVTLEPNCEVLYKVSSYYSPELSRGVRFDDPEIGIEWPLSSSELILSEKDRTAPMLDAAGQLF